MNGEWILKSNKEVKVIDSSGSPIENTVLSPLSIYNLAAKEQDHKMIVFTEPSTNDRQTFSKFLVVKDMDISIGRTKKNDVVLANQFVSATHAILSYRHGQWSIVDKNSTNGSFVNGTRVKSRKINMGDMIYIIGYKVIVGSCFVSINNPDQTISIDGKVLKPFINQPVEATDGEEDYEVPAIDYFYRSPRFKRDVEKAVMKIDSPPQNAIGEEMPLMLVLGPSVTMGMASMATAIFAINNAMATGDYSRAMPSIDMSCSKLLGTILWPVLSKKYDIFLRTNVEQGYFSLLIMRV
ncbi:FHA domain-containing protein [Neobacillus drentensis]|uniref:FHA domain-containing protein n=1 Tax=Neobacillus drentensis TaxID=220684 RepID=UPI002FFF1236